MTKVEKLERLVARVMVNNEEQGYRLITIIEKEDSTISGYLIRSFTWMYTAEGHKYWRAVWKELGGHYE